MARRFYRDRKDYQLFSPATSSGGARMVRMISKREGIEMFRRGRALPAMDRDGSTILRFQLLAAVAQQAATPTTALATLLRQRRHGALASGVPLPVATTITRMEVEAAADWRGSRTSGLSDEERADRVRRGWRAEDMAEKAKAKVAVYQTTH